MSLQMSALMVVWLHTLVGYYGLQNPFCTLSRCCIRPAARAVTEPYAATALATGPLTTLNQEVVTPWHVRPPYGPVYRDPKAPAGLIG
jgi:hypothetical protein